MTRRHLPLLCLVALCGCPADHTADCELPRDALDDSESVDGSDASDTSELAETETSPSDVATDSDADAAELPDAGPFTWPWPLETIDVAPDASWKARITFPEDPFLAEPLTYDPPSPRWVKFTVLTGDPTRVFFQDSRALPFHFDFGVAHLPPLAGMSPEVFDQRTLHDDQRKAILGAVLFAPYRAGAGPTAPEIGIQLVSKDPLDPRVATIVLELVRDAIDGVPLMTFYMPTYEQAEGARASAAAFAAAGFPLGSPERWSAGDLCYAHGWALGRLVELAPGAIDAAWRAGELLPSDILVTGQVPAELPPVAGIITREPSTPASHVAILAGTFEIPFVYVATAASQALVDAHIGQLVALRAVDAYDLGSGARCRLALTSALAIPEEDRAALASLKLPAPLDLPVRVSPGVLSVPAGTLTRADARSYGGKAANFGILRRAIPDASPDPAIAFSFDLFDRLMAQLAPDAPATTLGTAISQRLSGYAWPPDMGALASDLAAVRDLVKASSFAPEDSAAVYQALAAFGGAPHNIRFRSSTNVEDTASFTGAGLYDSYSGCLPDDTDDDGDGPSLCDASEPDERGVLRAIKKVYASFWNDNAFLARLQHRVRAADVAMGLLAHFSFPDGIERANGVAVTTDRIYSKSHTLTTQLGAVSVTNPSGGAQPEIVQADVYDFGTYLTPIQGSSLVPLGAHVLAWEDDYRALTALLDRVAAEWRKTVPGGTEFALDLEYKQVAQPGAAPTLEVKQVRPLPQPDHQTEVTSYLLPRAAPLELCTFQGEAGSLFGNHRGKLVVQLSHRPTFLDADNRERGFYTDIDVLLTGGAHVAGAPASLSGAFHAAPVRGEYDWSPRVDGFTLGSGESATEYAIETQLDWVVTRAEAPLSVIDDASIDLQIDYATPQFDPDYWDGDRVKSDYVRLGACPDDVVLTPDYPAVKRSAEVAGVTVDIRFWYPPAPTGATAGYTAPLAKWDRTVISGLTSAPLELVGYWSQTFRPGHHNFEEGFLFEPALEEGIAPELLAELADKDIRLVLVRVGYSEAQIKVIGADGELRDLALP